MSLVNWSLRVQAKTRSSFEKVKPSRQTSLKYISYTRYYHAILHVLSPCSGTLAGFVLRVA